MEKSGAKARWKSAIFTDADIHLYVRVSYFRRAQDIREEKMIRTLILAGGMALSANLAYAEEPIVGSWKTDSGETAQIVSCGGSYCVTLKTGKFAGKKIGTLAGTGGTYNGEITDPKNDKTYSGSGSVTGNSLKMKGCVLKVLCKSQSWTRL
ncbi:uncharacterized protein (DUF2147 family) [Rhizobium sullae]|uniref:Uncharacterized protein (DUF2147 family) n=2 Tax=Rhizobium sullae TaxID=50338 RepID=A0A4R3QF36_RHISU|nr:uncharacterized protein (DUF2147 family) [Rhizobium sullae]